MASGKYSFTIEQGSTVDFDIQWTDSGSNKINLAGYEAAMNIKSTYGSTAIITATSSIGTNYDGVRYKSGSAFLSLSGSGNCDTPLASGSIGLYIGHEHTTANSMSANEYLYDIELTNTVTEKRTRLVEGTIFIAKAITTVEPA
tara:strand:+ start:431 stop:862 length:432 start_codon:yes stop_codon:yes gene_type:complete